MNDINEDWLGLRDHHTAERGPALVVGAPMGPFELRAWEEMYDGGSASVVFTDESGDLDGPAEVERWRALLGWLRAPTSEEACCWLAARRAERLAAHWNALRAARALDEAAEKAVLDGRVAKARAGPVR